MPDSGMEDNSAQPAMTCSVRMWANFFEVCGRDIHHAPEHDTEPVCLMHSNDPAKSDEEFQIKFEQILAEAEQSKKMADFSGFVFPTSDYSGRTFAPACCFCLAEFTQDADFREAKFTQIASFTKTVFTQNADFGEAKFAQVNFGLATFTQVDFGSARFTEANFCLARFTQGANFCLARFTQGADFRGATFTQNADFSDATFGRDADFASAKLSGAVTFRATKFLYDFSGEAGLDFSGVKIEHPEKVEFYQTDLGQALFYNTDVSKMDFTLVEWRDRGRIEKYRRKRLFFRSIGFLAVRHRKAWLERWELLARTVRPQAPRFCVFDEDVELDTGNLALHSPEGSPDKRNYSLIAKTYQQLKRNYDAKGDYWTAGHWHYGEMEMKRLHSGFRFPPLRWLSHHFSLVALYKYASAYGESYVRPLVWLAAVLALFALAYPLIGFPPATGLELNTPGAAYAPGSLNYWNYAAFFAKHPAEHPSGFWGVLLHGAMTSLSVAGFQRELRYLPGYPWGRLLALVEVLLTTTLSGLFALAIRRQFKRS